jgi:hypothetical protein
LEEAWGSLSYRRLGLNGDHTGRHDLNRFHRMLRLAPSERWPRDPQVPQDSMSARVLT